MTSSAPNRLQHLSILIFSAREDQADGHGRAKVLYGDLLRRDIGIPIRHIDRMTSELESLTLVAKHKIVLSPCVLILKKGKAVARRIGVPNADDLLAYIEAVLE